MQLRLIIAVLLAVLSGGARLSADEPLVKNGSFEQWKDNLPEAWQVEVGARSGADEPLSEVRKIAGPAIAVSGDAKTMAWRSISQQLALEPSKTYRLTFQARSKGVKREGKQFDNSYVGFMSMNEAGKVIGRAVEDVSASVHDWTPFEIDYEVPVEATKTNVIIFLSKSGLIAVKGIAVVAARDQTSSNELLANGEFSKWTNGVPDGWTAEVGAKNGAEQPLSTIKPLGQAGIELRGNATTLAWQTLRQDVRLSERKTYALTFQASAESVQRQGKQFDNCYVGVMHFDGGGKRLDMTIEDLVQAKDFKEQSIRILVPAGTKKSSVMVFLSKSGALKVKDMRLEEAVSSRPFRGAR